MTIPQPIPFISQSTAVPVVYDFQAWREIDIAQIPRVRFVYGNTFAAGYLSVTFAAPKTGTCTHHHPLMGCGVVVVASDAQPLCTHLDVFMASNIRAQIGGPAMLITIRPGPVLHVWHCGKEAAAVQLTPACARRR